MIATIPHFKPNRTEIPVTVPRKISRKKKQNFGANIWCVSLSRNLIKRHEKIDLLWNDRNISRENVDFLQYFLVSLQLSNTMPQNPQNSFLLSGATKEYECHFN